MKVEVIENRLRQYEPANKAEELNAFKEISQEIALRAFSRTDFFKKAAFQGGTCLRIVYGLQRYSEDLDFVLQQPDPHFKWQTYLTELLMEFESYGLGVDIKDRSDAPGNVKKAFLKQDSFGRVLNLQYERNRSDIQSIKIKLEVDINPPAGSQFETKIIDFPTPFSILSQNEKSLFAGKLHALLCREYVKGRDWYDFIWYVTRKTKVNYTLLQYALNQQGQWSAQNQTIDSKWVLRELIEKIKLINWEVAKQDVSRFIKLDEQDSLQLWDESFFLHFVDKLQDYL